MQELTAKVTSRLLSFPAVTLEALGEDELSLASELRGHFTVERSGLAWLATGPQLEVVHAMTGERLSAYRFSTTRNHPPTIQVARDFSWLKRSGLLVGLEEEDCSMLCLYDLGLSRVVKAVAIPGRITAIEPLVSYGGASASTQHLHQGLRWFFGIAAVVTDLGHILLVDLCLDDLSCCQSDLKAADLRVAILGDEIPKVRELSRRTGQHTCLQLSKPSGVGVSALQFVSRTNQLCVGFSDGSIQLWNVKTLKREYHSMLDGGQVPIHAFTFQEPENDPRNCCYLWVVQSSQDLKGDMVSLHLLQLAFSERKCLSSGKILYEGLEYCEERYSQDFGGQVFPLGTLTTDTRLLSCQTIEKFRPHPDRDDSVNDVASPDTSVSVFVWQVKVYGQGAPTIYIGLFDINRWYHAQMPDSLRSGQSLQNCPYFAIWTVDPVVHMVSPYKVLDVVVHDRSLSRSLPLTYPPPEQYFNSTSYNFDATCLLDSGIVHLTCSGYQKETLSFLKKAAPCTSDNIASIYSRCLTSGLLSSRLSDSHSSSLSQEEQLDAIFSTAVETSSLRLITGCIEQWTAEKAPGCALSLRYILDWAWNKVVQTKEELDTICSPLFDCSSNFIDSLTLQLLQHSQRVLGNLSSIFRCLLTEAQELTQNGALGLMNKSMVSSLISKYAQVVLWFCRVGLLPEGPDDDSLPLARPIYCRTAIRGYYTAHREELRGLTKGSGRAGCLMIDGLVSQGGEALTDLWKRDVGGTGLYPPVTLHALLDIYLLTNIEEEVKHAIVIYLLLDVMYSSPNKEEASVESFPSAFAIPSGLMKLVQGFWLLDHRDDQRAFQMLLHPAVSKCQLKWQHERVLRVLMCRRQHSLALRYLQSARPAVSTCMQAELYLSVLLHNRCMIEALSLVRRHRSHLNLDQLLGYFFESCKELGLIKELLKLPLDATEQKYLENFLRTARGVVNRELLMVHYLQQANYIPALQLNQTLKTQLLTDRDPKQKERSITRNSIMHLYGKVLPRAQRKLAMERANPYQHPRTSHREVTRPQPLSTVIKRSAGQNVMSRAGFINNLLNKIEEVWLGTAGSPVASPAQSPVAAEVRSPTTCPAAQLDPFLGTPIPLSSKRQSRLVGLVFHPSRQSPVPPFCPLSPLGSKASSKRVSKAPEFSLLQTPQVVKRARALAAAGPVFSAFTPQSILRSSLRPTPVATPSASPGRSVTPPPRRKDNRITFIEDSSTPEAEKVVLWTNGEAAHSEVHLLTRESLQASRKTWSPQPAGAEDEDEGQPRVKFLPPQGGCPSPSLSVPAAAEGAEHSLLGPARINLSLDSSFKSAQSADEAMPSGGPEDRGRRAPEEEDDVVVVISETRQQQMVPQLTPGEADEMKEVDNVSVPRLVDADVAPRYIPGRRDFVQQLLFTGDGSPALTSNRALPCQYLEPSTGSSSKFRSGSRSWTNDKNILEEEEEDEEEEDEREHEEEQQEEEEEEEEEDSGSEVEIIEEVQGNGRLRTLQSGPMFAPKDQELFIPTLSEQEDAEFSLVAPGAQIKVVGEEMGGEVVMVRLGSEVEEDPGPESSYMEVKPSTTLLVPLELVDEQPDFNHLPDVRPADHHRCQIESSFSLMLDMDEDPAKEMENQLQFPETLVEGRAEVELQIQPETLIQMEEVVKPLEVTMTSSEDLDPVEEQAGVTFTAEDQQTPAEVEPYGVEEDPSAAEVDSSSEELKPLSVEERLCSEEEEPLPEEEEEEPSDPEELNTLPIRSANVKNENRPEVVQPIKVEETLGTPEPDGSAEEPQDPAAAATGEEKETRTAPETRRRTRATRNAEEAPEQMLEEQRLPDAPTPLRKKKAPSTPSRRTTRAKQVTFVSLSEDGEATGPEAPPSPSPTPRKVRKNTGSKVPASPTRRSTRRAAAAASQAEELPSPQSDSAVTRAASMPASTGTVPSRPSRRTPSITPEEAPEPGASSPAELEAPPRTPTRRSTRKVSHGSEAAPELFMPKTAAGVRHSARKTRSKVWEAVLLEEGAEPEPGPSPSRRARQTSQSAPPGPPRVSHVCNTGVLAQLQLLRTCAPAPPPAQSERTTRAGATSEATGDLPESTPLEVDSDALLERMRDNKRQEGEAVFGRTVRTRSKAAVLLVAPPPQDDVTSEDDPAGLRSLPRRAGTRATKSAAAPRLPSIAEALLISPLPSPAEGKAGPRRGPQDAESPTRGVSRRHKRVMDALVRRPVTRRKKL
ncbi:protein ELYS [Neosynchiropus ocellatus]